MYTALYDERAVGDLVPAARVRTSFLQRFPLRERLFRAYAPLYPRAFESFDLSAYDVVVVVDDGVGEGRDACGPARCTSATSTPSRASCSTRARYVGGFGRRALARPLVKRLAAWDVRAAQRPTRFVANSRNVAERVRRWYGREADVLPCPVDVDRFTRRRAAAATTSPSCRGCLPYKRVDLAIAGVRDRRRPAARSPAPVRTSGG